MLFGMDKLVTRVLHHDTNLIIFSVKDVDQYIPPLGKYLGDLTSELCSKKVLCKKEFCKGHWIKEIVGPKNYTFRINT